MATTSSLCKEKCYDDKSEIPRTLLTITALPATKINEVFLEIDLRSAGMASCTSFLQQIMKARLLLV